jgi:hypothetical protein
MDGEVVCCVLLAFVADADAVFAMISEKVVRQAMIGCCNFHLEPPSMPLFLQ